MNIPDGIDEISTHSLTKRLTVFHLVSVLSVQHFNSQPHEEADVFGQDEKEFYQDFNSQPHEEADSRMAKNRRHIWIFQLTASRRG